jgi:hypothetical protein
MLPHDQVDMETLCSPSGRVSVLAKPEQDQARLQVRSQVFFGQRIQISSDPGILVSQVFNNGWNLTSDEPLVMRNFLSGKSSVTNYNPPPSDGAEVRWTLEPSGRFSVASLYKRLFQ